MKKYFYLEESPCNKGKYMICLSHNEFPFEDGTKGSYNVIVARFLGLSYAQYLRFARDILGAELIGKNSLYIVSYFKRSDAVNQFIKLLNKRMELVMLERERGYVIEKNNEGELIKTTLDFGD